MFCDLLHSFQLIYASHRLFSKETSESISKLNQAALNCGVFGLKFLQFLMMNEGFVQDKSQLMYVFEDMDAHSWDDSCDIFKKSTGLKIDEVFDLHNIEPVGCGSIGQVYKLFHKQRNEYVAVKIKHPDIEKNTLSFMKNVSYVIYFLKWFMTVPYLFMLQEFINNIKVQLDYSIEAKNTNMMRDKFANEKNIIIPEVYEHYSDVIIMSFHDGIPYSKLHPQEQHQMAYIMCCLGISSLVNYDFFHCDLHFGNWKVCDDSIVLYDCGIVGCTGSLDLNKQMVTLTFKNDFEGLAKLTCPGITKMKNWNMLHDDLFFLTANPNISRMDKFTKFLNMVMKYGFKFDIDLFRCIQGMMICMHVCFESMDKIFQLMDDENKNWIVLICANYEILKRYDRFGALMNFYKDLIIEFNMLTLFDDWLDSKFPDIDKDMFIDYIISMQGLQI